jgi:hypothetical protein
MLFVTWEKFPVEKFKLVSVQRSCSVVTFVQSFRQWVASSKQAAKWEDPFEEKTMAAIKRKNYEDLIDFIADSKDTW